MLQARTLKGAIREMVDSQSRIISDDFSSYMGIGKEFPGGHHTVAHGTREYVRGDIHTNTVESSFAILKRGIMGIYHNVSKKIFASLSVAIRFYVESSQHERR